MDSTVPVVFLLVYFGMIVGGIPGLALDRTGVALAGAIALIAFRRVGLVEAVGAIDVSTMALLFGLMVVSAQLRLGGFYTRVVRAIGAAPLSPAGLLAVVIAVAGVLSALLANDIVCLAVTPVLVEACARRRLDPVPFLLALACASNVGSAATLIGNPQNMLIGQTLGLSFARYLWDGGVPAVLGLVVVWAVIHARYRGRYARETAPSPVDLPRFRAWQTTKGLLVLAALVVLFLVEPVPRDLASVTAAGVLLMSRHTASRDVLGLVDWQLLVLFSGLFIVNHAVVSSGLASLALREAALAGLDLTHPDLLFGAGALLSNLVSNVPAVMLLLPAAHHPEAGPALALSSTLAGNLVVVSSIANIIVVEQASRLGVRISWADHVRVGLPVTLATLFIAWAWLWVS